MSKLKLFVKKIEDFELASLYKFRFNSFMPYSQKIILEELGLRNIRKDNIDSYIKKLTPDLQTEIDSEKICPKCFSNEFYDSEEKENITFQYETHEYTKNYKTCLVCLYSQEKIDHKKERNTGASNIFSFLKFLTRNR